MQPRGIRNNNPLNIIKTSIPWQGKLDDEHNTDGRFEQFDTMEHGIQAAIKNVRQHIKQDARHLIRTTMSREIHRWCPDETAESYVQQVTKMATIQPNEILEYNNQNQICRLLWAMTRVENGVEVPFHHFDHAWLHL